MLYIISNDDIEFKDKTRLLNLFYDSIFVILLNSYNLNNTNENI